MGKALMIFRLGNTNAVQGNKEGPFFGADTTGNTEADAQVAAPVDCSFTRLSTRASTYTSGTNTTRLRDAGANGQNVSAITAADTTVTDTTNTDTLTAGDLFNWQHQITATNAIYPWVKINFEAASGHGNIHGMSNSFGAVQDVGSATRYHSIGNGALPADGNATEANVQWMNRGYTSIEHIQVRVLANARVNDTTFSVRVNGADATGGSITVVIGAGATGLIQSTGNAVSIADGDLINLAMTLGAGTEDLSIAFVATYCASSSNKSETFAGCVGNVRAASGTEHFMVVGGRSTDYVLTPITEANARVEVGFAATVSNLRIYISANTYTESATLTLYKNGVAAISLVIAAAATGWREETSTSFTVDPTDELSLGIDNAGTVGTGNLTPWDVGFTFSPVSSQSVVPVIARQFRKRWAA